MNQVIFLNFHTLLMLLNFGGGIFSLSSMKTIERLSSLIQQVILPPPPPLPLPLLSSLPALPLVNCESFYLTAETEMQMIEDLPEGEYKQHDGLTSPESSSPRGNTLAGHRSPPTHPKATGIKKIFTKLVFSFSVLFNTFSCCIHSVLSNLVVLSH